MTLFCNAIEAQDLIPLKTGNYWKYEETTFDIDYMMDRDTVINKVKGTKRFNDREWFLIDEFGDEFLVRSTKAGHMELDSLSKNRQGNFTEVLMFKKPSKVKNLTYTTFGKNQVMVSRTPVKIQTVLGVFTCYKYTIIPEGGNAGQIETYISPGIGIVYQNWKTDIQHVKSRLIEYKID
jgi:hypothetical protein